MQINSMALLKGKTALTILYGRWYMIYDIWVCIIWYFVWNIAIFCNKGQLLHSFIIKTDYHGPLYLHLDYFFI